MENPNFSLFDENKFCENYNSQYVDYMKNIYAILEDNGIGSIMYDFENAYNLNESKSIKVLYDIEKILRRAYKDETYNIKLDINNLKKKSLQDYASGISAYIKHFKNPRKNQNAKEWNEKYGEEAECIHALANNIDGTTSLLALLGNNSEARRQFIKKVLEDSYFFDPQMVKNQFDEVAKKYSEEGSKMDARWTEWYKSSNGPFPNISKEEIKKKSKQCNDVKFKISKLDGSIKEQIVKLDDDGNRAVRELIKRITGYQVSFGKKSEFQFYKISHIWGEAYDPRKFTNLWNIVLVPAWANDLLDKQNTRDILTQEFHFAVKQVCISFYKMDKLEWDKIDMSQPTANKLNIHENFKIKYFKYEKGKSYANGEYCSIKKKEVAI